MRFESFSRINKKDGIKCNFATCSSFTNVEQEVSRKDF